MLAYSSRWAAVGGHVVGVEFGGAGRGDQSVGGGEGMEPIRFVAVVQKVQTLADGGLRITLDLPETAIMQAAELMVCKRDGVVLDIECKKHDPDSR